MASDASSREAAWLRGDRLARMSYRLHALRQLGNRRRQHILDSFREDELHFLANRLWHFTQIFFILLGENSLLNAGATGSQDFFLDPANGQDKTRQGDF